MTSRRHLLEGHKYEGLVNSTLRRCSKLGYRNNGGFQGLTSGWVRLSLNERHLQVTYNIDGDGIVQYVVNFYKTLA